MGEGLPQLRPESSSVDCENFREGQYTVIPEGFPLDPYVHAQAGMARAMIHLGGKDGLG